MNLTRDRVRSIGWAFVLTVCAALTLALTFRVNAVKSEVRLAERRLVALQQEKLFLETEFEARSNQQQLTALNAVEFGYEAPKAEQYIEGERQLSSLGKARPEGAPAPIRVASAADGDALPAFPAMVSPVTGKPVSGGDAPDAADGAASGADGKQAAAKGAGLSRIALTRAARP